MCHPAPSIRGDGFFPSLCEPMVGHGRGGSLICSLQMQKKNKNSVTGGISFRRRGEDGREEGRRKIRKEESGMIQKKK